MANAILLKTSSLADIQPLTISGQLLTNSYWTLQDELRKIGQEHAGLLSEPNRNSQRNEIEWTSNLVGKPVPFDKLDAESRRRAEVSLTRLLNDVTGYISRLKASDDKANQRMAEELEFALEVPNEQDIFLIGRQPVLTNWGHVPRGPVVPQQLLWKIVAEAEAAQKRNHEEDLQSQPAPVPRVAEPTGLSTLSVDASGVAVLELDAANDHGFWLTPLLWLLLGLLLLLIGSLLLRHCGIGLPSLYNWAGHGGFNYCSIGERARLRSSVHGKRTALEQELARLKEQLEMKRQACVLAPPSSPSPAPLRKKPSYLVKLERPIIRGAQLCQKIVCNPNVKWRRKQKNKCPKQPPEAINLPSKVMMKGYCHVVVWVHNSAENSAGNFSSKSTLSIDKTQVKAWTFKGRIPSRDMVNFLKSKGRYYTYYVGKFRYPAPPAQR